ncbi:MAG: tetratricopeptide repeat protein [Nitrospinae bacterium]|nr:tetratricopeptide repeat protein [Nitrospinota bacterium]
MELDKVYRVIRFLGIGMIFLSLSWAIFKSSTPSERRPSFAKAVGLYTDGKFEEALEFYEIAISEYPEFVHAKRGRARSLMQLGRDQQALEAFNEVLSLDPDSAVSIANRAILEDRMGLYAKAIEDYERAMKMDPKLEEGLDWFTRFLQNRKGKKQTLPERVETLKGLLEEEKKQNLPKTVPDVHG